MATKPEALVDPAPRSAPSALAGMPLSAQRGLRDAARPSHAPIRPTVPPQAPRPKHGVVTGPHVHPPVGTRLGGPPIAAPSLNQHALHRNTRALVEQFLRHSSTTPMMAAPLQRRAPNIDPRAATIGTRRASTVDIGQPNLTGINRWWSYEEGAIPGVGRYMINMWQQNLIVQADDMDVHYRGIDLAFRRTYNSYSNHDYAGSDGSVEIGQYGNGWTNTFDAHMTQNSAGGMSIYDVDGARYDYSYDASGNLVPPLGMEGTSLVTYDGGSFYWTKKTGTQYTFYAPYYTGSAAAYSGRIYRISGRNRNNYIQFSYGWDNGDASTSAHLNQIYATTDSGMTSKLGFEDFNGRRLCWYIQLPENATRVWYGYDDAGNLTVVRHEPRAAGEPSRYEGYGGYRQWMWVSSPRWNNSGTTEGGNVSFHFVNQNSSQVDGINFVGVMNFAPADGTGTYLQNGSSTTEATYNYASIWTAGDGATLLSDTDGHAYQQNVDAVGRPTSRYVWTGTQSLVTAEAWDAHNNRIADVDARNKETDYAYDANDNAIAVGEPYTTTSQGSFRPTKLYDYDAYNNVVAYCDEKASHANGGRGDWTNAGPPTAGGPDALCASNGEPAHAIFTYPINPAPAYEPFGQLTNIRSPLGYNRAIAYAAAQQGGADYGLPTSVRGDPIAQADGSRTPFQTLSYDAAGNLICSSSDGNDPTNRTVLLYDSLNRVVAVGDPDDATVTSGACPKTPGIVGSAIATRTTYFPNGEVATTQTPAEAAANVSTQFQYDLDGNVTSEQRHNAPNAGPTLKWYDGADRLVEVRQPTDANYDFYTFPWTTRYLYDLTQGGTVTIASSAPYHAYGGLFKTQEYLPNGVTTPQWNEAGSVNGPSTGTSNPGWQDTAGTAYDALDRPVLAFRNTGAGLMPVTNTYDGPGNAGLLSQRCNANNECQAFTYDARGARSQATYNVPSSSTQNFSLDEVGRVAAASNGIGGFTDVYDADGRKTSRQETVGSTTASIRYAYYDDGLRRSLDATVGTQNLTGVLAYSYRADGLIRQLGVASTYTFSFAYTGGRRLTSRSDTTGQAPDNFTYTGSGSPASYGLVQSMTTPGFYETGMTYNAEGGQLGGSYYGNNGSGWFPGHLIQAVYTTRGEVVVDTSGSGQPSLYANGMRIQTARTTATGNPKTALFSFNALQSMPVGSNNADTCVQCLRNDSSWGYGYDAAGRQVTAKNTSNFDNGLDQPAYFQYTNTKSYDAEDHLLVQLLPWIPFGKYGAYQRSLAYQWGPVGHPLKVGSSSAVSPDNPAPSDFQYDTLIWDDDDLLFTVNSAGQINDLKVADFADYVPGASNPLTVWDRDTHGQIYGCHTGGAASTVASSAFQATTIACGASSSFVGPQFGPNQSPVGRGGMLLIPKSDGFSDGQNTFQGVRTYDPQAGVWTTPDAYHGDVHDPMSQKPYMWNRNNPYQYSDPSGYKPWLIEAWETLLRVMRGDAAFVSSYQRLDAALVSSSGGLSRAGAQVVGWMRSAPRIIGNYKAGTIGDVQQANRLGEMWTGAGRRLNSSGNGWISKDGSRGYRFPTLKSDGEMKANFEYLKDGKEISNGHIYVRPGGPLNITLEDAQMSGDMNGQMGGPVIQPHTRL